MAIHWGIPRLGRLKFDIGTLSYKVDGVRQTHRQWRAYDVTGIYGVSFGQSRFFGLMTLKERAGENERIK